MAAGFGLKEHSAEAMGSAYAGAAASGSAQALSYNPASLAGVATNDASISLVEILPSSSANYSVATTAAGTQASGTRTPCSPARSIPAASALPWPFRVRFPVRWTAVRG